MKAFVKVYGDVHGVGFRSYVSRLSRQLGLKGLVKNELDGTVKVFLDGSEVNVRDFVKIVAGVKRSGFFGSHVDNVEVFFEGEKGFQPAWKAYSCFEIDY